ncbi:C40 family peptidase [Micromonospora craniellae]|uniref:NlpC/P60 family protein n=1 Tax=Micromonospora craniellae TaxID=2294034 RepID=A0A372FW85_9ACTN|nr:C40 family peptidase [Micromonospora craniellae]QOC94144.1 C40 family peptidase [Micromonospora craniellae]RFS45047.1 NlpC/P60 family protein [Micromonospora craniellae]
MVDSLDGRRRRRRSPMISPVLRPMLWSALLGAVASAVLAAPAYAEPGIPVTVPDTGSRPAVAGQFQLPGGAPTDGTPGVTAPTATPAGNALEAQIAAVEARIGELGTQLLDLQQQRTEAETQHTAAGRTLEFARAAVTQAAQRADQVAAEAIKVDAAQPPGDWAATLRDLERLHRANRGERSEGVTGPAAGQVTRARADEQVATQAYTAAEQRLRGVQQQYTLTQQSLREEEARLIKLREENSAQLIALARQQEAAEQRLGADYVDQSADGLVAHPTALAALAYARRQLGDPYVWGATGPNSFDCSGLIWSAYRSAGYYKLPRVSRDQYYATRSRTVPRNALLPGDLVFFASGSSWRTIHHMGMYVGGGKMIHAPTTGDVVKISTVRWSRLFAATRVVGGVPGPTASPTPSQPPAPKPTPKPTSKPTTSPTPTPTPRPTSPSPSPSGSPTPTPTGSPSPSVTPSPSTSPTQSPSTSPTPSTESSSPAPTSSSLAPTTAASSTAAEESASATPSAVGGR